MTIIKHPQKSLLKSLIPLIAEPKVVNFWLGQIHPLWSLDQSLGQIVAREQVASDMLRLTIRCNAVMDFGQCGQHHPISIEIKGRRYQRHYSLTRVDRQHVQLHVKRVKDGLVSNWLWDEAKIGQLLSFGKPYGEVTLPNLQQRRLLWLAAGSGITPMFSLLNQLATKGQLAQYQITLLYWARHHDEFAFTEQLKAWQHQYPHVKVQFFCTQQAPFDQRLNAAHLTSLGDLSSYSVFACGPSDFVKTARELCANASQLQTEAFSLSMQPLPQSSSDTEQSVAVTLTKSGRNLSIPMGQSILQALEHAGLEPSYGCRMGICNQCVCHKVSGITQDLNNGVHNAEPAQSLKICINTAQSDLILAL